MNLDLEGIWLLSELSVLVTLTFLTLEGLKQ